MPPPAYTRLAAGKGKMNRHGAVFGRVARAAILAGWLYSLVCLAQTNSWIIPASGHWENLSWSLGIPPAVNQSVMITNGGSKAVGVFPTTAANFPGTMTVSNLTIYAPSNSQNTLLLNFVGTAVPLQVLNDCTIGTNGSILNLSSSLWIGQSFSVTGNGSFIQQGGLTVSTNPWSVEIEGGTVAVTNGVFLFAEMDVGGGGSFTQAGGNVSGGGAGIGLNVRDGGTYNLIDGFLSGSLYVENLSTNGGTFNQSGGTNNVSGNLNVSGVYALSGGLLTVSNSFEEGANFVQNGGVHLESETFVCGDYLLNGGTLVAPSIELFGTLAIGASPAASINNTTSFAMQAGGLQLSNCTASLAPLALLEKLHGSIFRQ